MLGEATRLLAWIIKYSKNGEVIKNIVRADGIQHLVTMATSEHVLMQNEALIALTLIIGSSVLGIELQYNTSVCVCMCLLQRVRPLRVLY